MRRKLVRIGNSLGVTLPPSAISSLGVVEGDSVDVEVENDHVLITSRPALPTLLAAWLPIAEDVPAATLDRLIREDRDTR
jgi:antitoxin component of MazEF toxin-antitoxin module